MSTSPTLVPVQLVNPTGSSSGQAIVSTGSSSAPAWGGIGVNGIAPIAANTVIGNATNSSASPTALAIPSCSGTGGALQWAAGTGFTCEVNIFASPPSTGYGSTTAAPVSATTISASSTITPSQTNGIVGTTTNNNANSGSYGEYLTGTTTGSSATSGTSLNAASVSLTAGDWDVTGIIQTVPGTGTTQTSIATGISTQSATIQNITGSFQNTQNMSLNFSASAQINLTAPVTRISIASTTTIYLVAYVVFGVSTLSVDGFIRARRIR